MEPDRTELIFNSNYHDRTTNRNTVVTSCDCPKAHTGGAMVCIAKQGNHADLNLGSITGYMPHSVWVT